MWESLWKYKEEYDRQKQADRIQKWRSEVLRSAGTAEPTSARSSPRKSEGKNEGIELKAAGDWEFVPFQKWLETYEPEEAERRRQKKQEANAPNNQQEAEPQPPGYKEQLVDAILYRVMVGLRTGLLKLLIEGVAICVEQAQVRFQGTTRKEPDYSPRRSREEGASLSGLASSSDQLAASFAVSTLSQPRFPSLTSSAAFSALQDDNMVPRSQSFNASFASSPGSSGSATPTAASRDSSSEHKPDHAPKKQGGQAASLLGKGLETLAVLGVSEQQLQTSRKIGDLLLEAQAALRKPGRPDLLRTPASGRSPTKTAFPLAAQDAQMVPPRLAAAAAYTLNAIGGILLSYRFELNVAGDIRPCEVGAKEPRAARFVYFRQLGTDHMLQGIRQLIRCFARPDQAVRGLDLDAAIKSIEKLLTAALHAEAKELQSYLDNEPFFQLLATHETVAELGFGASVVEFQSFLRQQVSDRLEFISKAVPGELSKVICDVAQDLLALEPCLDQEQSVLNEDQQYLQLRQKLQADIDKVYRQLDEQVTMYLQTIIALLKMLMIGSGNPAAVLGVGGASEGAARGAGADSGGAKGGQT
eukprot:g20950.t1